MSPAPASEPPATFSIKVSSGLYLDNENRFLSSPAAGAPVYEVGGGVLSLSGQVSGQLISGTLAVLPVKDQPAWQGKLRGLGVDESDIKLFGDVADLAGSVITIFGWGQAAFKFAEMLGILKTGKSVEQLAKEILTKLGIVQDMVGDLLDANVRTVLDTSASEITAQRDLSAGLLKTLAFHNVAERREIRRAMVNHAAAMAPHIGAILSDSRWKMFNQTKLYKGTWAFMSETEEIELLNAPWWGTPRFVPRKALGDDGHSWIDAVYEPAHKPRFDYRAALPFAMHGILAYVTALTMAEPEFRSTGKGREQFNRYADDLGRILKQMRAVLVRSRYTAYDFTWAGPEDAVASYDPDTLLGPEPKVSWFVPPRFRWQVGAWDLCANTDSQFNQLAALASRYPDPPASYKLAGVDFDWLPPDPKLVSIAAPEPHNAPHWEIANPQACADAANRQSEADYAVLLQTSGYLQLAQLQAMLRHLATDPVASQTVTGGAAQYRHETASSIVEAVGRAGLGCSVSDVTMPATRELYECRTMATITLQEPDRFDMLPIRFLLVALSAPADSGYEVVQSEVELTEGTAAVTLPKAQTFDWYIELTGTTTIERPPSHAQLAGMATRRMQALTLQPPGSTIKEYVWHDIAGIAGAADMPAGEVRNVSDGTAEFTCTLTRLTTDQTRGARVEVTSAPAMRNARHIYVAVEETLYSGKRLRTHFPVEVNTQLTFLPPSFFERERKCLKKTMQMIEFIDRHYTESAPRLPPDVPITIGMVGQHAAALQAQVPELVQRAMAAANGDS